MESPSGYAFAPIKATFQPAGEKTYASSEPGDAITRDDAAMVEDLVSLGNFALVKQGMVMPTERLEWPPPYKSATEKYLSQAD
ncbi:MAG TPA: hypothetical protein VMT64_03825 [Candidatus Binataceae bacterium]|nr:hypothetical protein [Candidatus Binataceae bacterium]